METEQGTGLKHHLRGAIKCLVEEMAALYLSDCVPWIVGFSGGKDSTATLQLAWMMLESLPAEQRTKPVHAISTDTLVENPVISAWLDTQHAKLKAAAEAKGLPLVVHKLQPELEQSFWVNLIGRGYPAPRPKFRWCTERLKIAPSNAFIMSLASKGGAILCLGTRKAESTARARAMNELEKQRVRDRLSPNKALPGSLVYSPIEAWSNDEVWLFLMQWACPWSPDGNKALMSLYASASADNECPIVVDTSTPSCGASRFGCWTCTMVEQDKSLTSMIDNDPGKDWLRPLVELRNRLDVSNDRHLRDFRRMNGLVQIMSNGKNIPGPYHEDARHQWLEDLLNTEALARKMAPPEFRDLRLISDAELELIQRIWVRDKNEIDDALPGIVWKYRAQKWDRISPAPAGVVRALQSASADRHTFQFVRDVWGARLAAKRAVDVALKAVARRYEFRTAEEAIQTKSHQPSLLAPATRNADAALESFAMNKAADAAAKVPENDAPWVALAVLDRTLGRGCRSQETPYVAQFYSTP